MHKGKAIAVCKLLVLCSMCIRKWEIEHRAAADAGMPLSGSFKFEATSLTQAKHYQRQQHRNAKKTVIELFRWMNYLNPKLNRAPWSVEEASASAL